MVYVALTCFNGYLSEGEIARTSTGRTAQAGRKNTRANNARNNVSKKESEGKIARSVTLSKMTKVDWIAMAVITLIYAGSICASGEYVGTGNSIFCCERRSDRS